MYGAPRLVKICDESVCRFLPGDQWDEVCEREREGERERERQTPTHRQTDTHTHTQREKIAHVHKHAKKWAHGSNDDWLNADCKKGIGVELG